MTNTRATKVLKLVGRTRSPSVSLCVNVGAASFRDSCADPIPGSFGTFCHLRSAAFSANHSGRSTARGKVIVNVAWGATLVPGSLKTARGAMCRWRHATPRATTVQAAHTFPSHSHHCRWCGQQGPIWNCWQQDAWRSDAAMAGSLRASVSPVRASPLALGEQPAKTPIVANARVGVLVRMRHFLCANGLF